MVARESSAVAPDVERELVLTRTFAAPRRLVFQAWTDPKWVAQWWGPHGFTNPVCELDVRPGGAIRINMRAPDGNIYPVTGTYREIVAPERIVFTSSALDDAGHPVGERLTTVTFAEQGERTTVTVRMRVLWATPAAAPYLAGMEAGWTQILERLEAHVVKPDESLADRQILMTRTFDAPRELVFEAWTQAEHLAQWWGPRGFSLTTHEIDVRPGGVWRFTMHGPDGTDYRNRIVFLEIVKPARLAYKHDPEKETEPVNFQVSVTFQAQDEKTGVTVWMIFPSAAAREYVVQKYGADEGLKQTLERLAEHLARP